MLLFYMNYIKYKTLLLNILQYFFFEYTIQHCFLNALYSDKNVFLMMI